MSAMVTVVLWKMWRCTPFSWPVKILKLQCQFEPISNTLNDIDARRKEAVSVCIPLRCYRRRLRSTAAPITVMSEFITVCVDVFVGVCVWVLLARSKENPWSQWLETGHDSSTRHYVQAYWFPVQKVGVLGSNFGLGMGSGMGLGFLFGLGLAMGMVWGYGYDCGLWFRVKIRELAPICISRKCTYLLVLNLNRVKVSSVY